MLLLSAEAAPNMEPQEKGPKFLTIKEAADLLKVSRNTIYRHILDGTIKGAFRFGSSNWRIDRDIMMRAFRGE